MLSLIVTALTAKASSLLFGGDIMLNRIQPSVHVFEGIRDLTLASDLSFANLEIPLTNSTTRTSRKSVVELKAKTQWILQASPSHAAFLGSSGFSMVSLANNHAMDYGRQGLMEMTSLLDKYKVNHSGAGLTADLASEPAVAELQNHKKVALLSVLGFMTPKALWKATPATSKSAGVAVLSFGGNLDKNARDKLGRWVQACREKADYVVIGIHWGVERKPLPTLYQVQLGRALVDAGADIVWGNHPHVLQGAELYKGHLIMYSMGNLVSNLPASAGFFKVQIADNGAQAVQFVPAKNRNGCVSLLPRARQVAAIRSMKELCRMLLKRYPSADSVSAL